MSSSNLDAAREVERLQKLHGNLIINPPHVRVRGTRWVVLASATVFVIGIFLLAIAWIGLRAVDRTDRLSAAAKRGSLENRSRLRAEWRRLAAEERIAIADEARADATLDSATDRLAVARSAKASPKEIRRLELAQNAAKADKDSRTTEVEARRELAQMKEREWLDAVADFERSSKERPPLFGDAFAKSSPSAHALAVKGLRMGSHVFAVIGALCFFGGFCVAFIPWVQQRAAALLEDLVKGTVAPSTGTLVSGGSPLSVFPTPVRPLFGGGEAGAMGRVTLQTLAASSAVALTVGAFTLAIPGRSIDLALQETAATTAGVNVGAFDIHIPGKAFNISPDNVVLRGAETRVDVPELALHLPPVAVTGNDSLGAFAEQLRLYRLHLESTNRNTERAEALQTAHNELFQRYAGLVAELQARPTKAEFESLGKRVDEQTRASTKLDTAVTDLKNASVELRKGSDLNALELARTINSQNDRLFNTVFRQTLIEQNCATYEWLAEKFPDLIAPKGCIKRPRFDPFVNPSWHAPSPYKTPPSRLAGAAGLPEEKPTVVSSKDESQR